MKRYTELTRGELSNLSNDQVQKLIDLEIAINGIIPIDRPVYQECEELTIKPTETVYYFSGILFKNQEDAVAVMKMDRYQESYKQNIGYEYKYLIAPYEVGVDIKKFYSEEGIIALSNEIAKFRRIKSENEELKRVYDKYVNDTSSIRNDVYRAISDAREAQSFYDNAKRVYQKHLDLADNDVEVANRFFRDAYKNYPDTIKEVLGE